MLTGAPLTVTSSRIVSFYKTNDNRLGNSLLKLASGKKVRAPADNIPDYFRAQRIMDKNRSYEQIGRGIAEGAALVAAAENAGETVFNGVTRLKQLTEIYYQDDTTVTEKEALQAEFSSVVNTVQNMLTSARYDGKLLIQDTGAGSLKNVALSPDDVDQQLQIKFTADQIADVSGLTLGASDKDTELGAIEGQLQRAGSYLASVSAYSHGLHAQHSIINTYISVNEETAHELTDADTGEEMVRSMNESIRNESSLAMLAQANMFRASVMQLF